MTMLSFRVEDEAVEDEADEEDAAAAQRWAERLGVDRSELLRDALRRHLLRLASEDDARIWAEQPMSAARMVQACRVLAAATAG